jgi:adenosylcobinamide-phosphate synthase
VAENTVDGVIAPIFFAFLAGPQGAMIYKAVSTLDSTFGYRNQRYMQFGWAAARLDDLVNWLPARLTAPLMAVGAGLAGMRAKGALRVVVRDHSNHPSPNSGWPEAAMAGALGVQLGGMSYYQNRPSWKPSIGDAIRPLNRAMIVQANRLMKITTLLLLLMLLGSRWLLR